MSLAPPLLPQEFSLPAPPSPATHAARVSTQRFKICFQALKFPKEASVQPQGRPEARAVCRESSGEYLSWVGFGEQKRVGKVKGSSSKWCLSPRDFSLKYLQSCCVLNHPPQSCGFLLSKARVCVCGLPLSTHPIHHYLATVQNWSGQGSGTCCPGERDTLY